MIWSKRIVLVYLAGSRNLDAYWSKLPVLGAQVPKEAMKLAIEINGTLFKDRDCTILVDSCPDLGGIEGVVLVIGAREARKRHKQRKGKQGRNNQAQ